MTGPTPDDRHICPMDDARDAGDDRPTSPGWWQIDTSAAGVKATLTYMHGPLRGYFTELTAAYNKARDPNSKDTDADVMVQLALEHLASMISGLSARAEAAEAALAATLARKAETQRRHDARLDAAHEMWPPMPDAAEAAEGLYRAGRDLLAACEAMGMGDDLLLMLPGAREPRGSKAPLDETVKAARAAMNRMRAALDWSRYIAGPEG